MGSFEVRSDHGEEVDGGESTNETTDMMPPLPLDSWFKRRRFAGCFENLAMSTERRRVPFLDCWDDKQEQFDALQQFDPWARNAPKSVPDVKGCLSVNFPACSVCQKLGVYQRLPVTAPREGED